MAIQMAEPDAVVISTTLTETEEATKEASRPLTEFTETELIEEIQRRRDVKAEPTEAPIALPPGASPPGFAWVFNRTASPFSWQKNSITYEIPAHSFGLFSEDVAHHGHKRSILLLDPVLQKAVFALALENDPMFAKPLKMRKRIELLDRTTQSNLTPYAAEGGKTRAVPFELDEVKAMLARRIDAFVELE